MPIAQRSATFERHALAPLGEPWLQAEAFGAGLARPVAALRASLEGLSAELRAIRPLPAVIPGVLEEVELLGRNVESLIAFARSPEPHPLRCSVEEILRSAARAFLPFKQRRPRLVLVHPSPDASMVVDGPLLSRLLARLIENALEASDQEDVLLIARREREEVEFCVLNHTADDFDVPWALQPFRSTKPNRLGLGLPIAERDARVLGGRLSLASSPGGDVRAQISLPAATPTGQPQELAA